MMRVQKHPNRAAPCVGGGTPQGFDFSFDGYANFLDAFARALGVERFAIYLHDFGSPIGARLAIKEPSRVIAQIIQNGDIPYEDALGDKYAEIEATWALPEEEMRAKLAEAVNENAFREEFLNEVRPELVVLIHWTFGSCTGPSSRHSAGRSPSISLQG